MQHERLGQIRAAIDGLAGEVIFEHTRPLTIVGDRWRPSGLLDEIFTLDKAAGRFELKKSPRLVFRTLMRRRVPLPAGDGAVHVELISM